MTILESGDTGENVRDDKIMAYSITTVDCKARIYLIRPGLLAVRFESRMRPA